jgi:hypothetical protein
VNRNADLRLILVLVAVAMAAAASGAVAAQPSCTPCHRSFAWVLPQGHVPVEGRDIRACLDCHPPADSAAPAPNPFAAKLHRAHENRTTKLDCTTCHTWNPGQSFGLPGTKVSYGAPSADELAAVKDVTYSWSASSYLDSRHAKADVSCAACHGRTLPAVGDRLENEQCFKCHGSYADLARKTTDPAHPDRNPHQSHLGEIACNACHKAHRPSSVYCLGCHPKFTMTIPGAAK